MTPDTSLGIDYSIRSGPDGDDLDGTFQEITGSQVMLEDAYKTVTTEAGSLFWAPSDTIDVTNQIGDSQDTADAQLLQAQIDALLVDDPRIQDVSVEVTYDQTTASQSIKITETPVTGETFTLTITPNSNAVDVEEVE